MTPPARAAPITISAPLRPTKPELKATYITTTIMIKAITVSQEIVGVMVKGDVSIEVNVGPTAGGTDT
jgi:hypothetical protein